jgi:Tol biopolymer transport system component
LSVVVPGGVRWSRDGHELYYISSSKDGTNIWAQPLNGGAPRQTTHFEGVDLFSFDWSEDGKQLTLSRGFQARDVMVVKDARQK